jgi:Flp pilus assembly protein TadD
VLGASKAKRAEVVPAAPVFLADTLASLARGDVVRALHVAGHALQLYPEHAELHVVSAIAHERLGALAEAVEHLAAVLAADPNHLEANQRLAPLLGRLGDRAGMVRCLRRIVSFTDGQDLDALTALGIALAGEGQHTEAIRLLSDVVRCRPDAVPVRADLAMALLGAGQLDEALTGFSEVLRLDPRSAQAHCGIGLVYQQLQRWGEAAAAFRATEALAPQNPVGPFNLGLVLAAAGDRDEARRALLRAAGLAPDDAEIRAALQALLAAPVVAPPVEPAEQSAKDAGIEPARQPVLEPLMETMMEPLTEPPTAPLTAPPAEASSPSPPEAPAPTARFGGDLKSFELTEVLEFLRLQKKTGSLVLSSRPGAGVIRIARGQVTSASAPGVARLGDLLVSRGIVTQAAVDAALARQKAGEPENGEVLGTVLLRDRPADRDQVTRVVFAQLLDAVGEMLGWREGTFSFHPGRDADPPAVAFDLQNVMLEVFRISDERKHNEEDR